MGLLSGTLGTSQGTGGLLSRSQATDLSPSSLFDIAPPNFSVAASTPATNSGFTVGGLLKNVAQGFARSTAAFGASLAAIPGRIADVIQGKLPTTPFGYDTFDVAPADSGLGKLERAIYGTDQPISFASEAKSLPFGLGSTKAALPLSVFAGVLDLTGAGEEAKGLSGLTRLLTATKDATEAETLLKNAGFANDLAKNAAPRFAQLTDSTAVQDGLLRLQDLQNTTKLIENQSVQAAQEASQAAARAAEVSRATPGAGALERGFTTSVKETFPELSTRVAGQYIPRSTDALATAANDLIKSDVVKAENLARFNTSDTAIATASQLIGKYTEAAANATDPVIKGQMLDRAALIANDAARNLTELGRSVQAASLLGRLTPEGFVRFAAREIQKYNEGVLASKGTKTIPELSGSQAERIYQRAQAIAKMPDGTEKAVEFKRLTNDVEALVPTPLYKKLIAVWKAGLLTGIKTSGLNTFANLFHGVTEFAKDIPAAFVDSVASFFTGRRTLALTSKGILKGTKEGFDKGWSYVKTGYDERNAASKLDYKEINFGDSQFAKAIQAYEQTIFRVIGAEDQPFYYGAKARSLASQAAATAKNEGLKGSEATARIKELVANPTDEMLRYATTDAEMSVFQNSTYLGKIASTIQKIPGGEIVVPFGKTPAAIAMQIINYSPVGIVKTIVENGIAGKFDQRLFSQGIGRGVLGTAASAYVGRKLYDKGIITLGYPTNETEQKQWELEGKTANSILIDGKWRSMAILGPIAVNILGGAYFEDALKKSGSVFEAMATAAGGMGQSLTDQTFLKGINSLTDAISDPQRSATSFFSGLIGSLVPTIVSDVAAGTDSYQRLAPGVFDRLIARTPGARETLQPKVNVLGQKVNQLDFWETLLDPTRPSAASTDPIVLELKRLSDAGQAATPSQLGTKTGYKGLTPQENTDLWLNAGTILRNKLTHLFQTPAYQKMDDETKKKYINEFSSIAGTIARAQAVLKVTNGLAGEDLKNKLGELKKNGLLTQEVFKTYLELR